MMRKLSSTPRRGRATAPLWTLPKTWVRDSLDLKVVEMTRCVFLQEGLGSCCHHFKNGGSFWMIINPYLKKNGGKRRRGPETPGKKFILPRRLPVNKRYLRWSLTFVIGFFFEGSYPAPAYVPPPQEIRVVSKALRKGNTNGFVFGIARVFSQMLCS